MAPRSCGSTTPTLEVLGVTSLLEYSSHINPRTCPKQKRTGSAPPEQEAPETNKPRCCLQRGQKALPVPSRKPVENVEHIVTVGALQFLGWTQTDDLLNWKRQTMSKSKKLRMTQCGLRNLVTGPTAIVCISQLVLANFTNCTKQSDFTNCTSNGRISKKNHMHVVITPWKSITNRVINY